jgi:hypothetical protein
VLPAAQGHPHAQRNRADDDRKAHELEARRVVSPTGHYAADADRDARTTTTYFMGHPFRDFGYPARLSGSFRDKFEQVSGLAVEYPAHCLQGAEANSLGTTVLQHRHVRRRQPDTLGEFPEGTAGARPRHHSRNQGLALDAAVGLRLTSRAARSAALSGPARIPNVVVVEVEVVPRPEAPWCGVLLGPGELPADRA